MAFSYTINKGQEYGVEEEQLHSSLPHDIFNIDLSFQHLSPLNLEEALSQTFRSRVRCRRDTLLSEEHGPRVVSLIFAAVNTVDAFPEFIQIVTDDILSFARQMHADPFNLGRKAITLLIEVNILIHAIDDVPSPNFKPASRSFIQSLKRVRLGERDEAYLPLKKRGRFEGLSSETQQCSICLDELSDGDEVAFTPCQHVFHGDCIVKWLETSHLCPLCRHQMPTGSEN